MSRLTWDDRNYSSGADHAVVYPRNGEIVVWNGLTEVTEKPSDIRERVRYRDGVRSVNQRAEDSFAATVVCFTYPDAVSNPRSVFDMSYRVKTGKGYEIHLVYNAMARSTGGVYKQGDVLTPFTLDIFTRPRAMPLMRMPSAHVVLDASTAYPSAIVEVEKILYGDDHTDPRMPSPDDLVPIFDLNSYFQVVDNGDGTATLIAPDDIFEWLSATEAEVDWPYVNRVSDDTLRIRSF